MAVKNTRGNITFISLSLASLNTGMVGWVDGKERRGTGRKRGSFGPLSASAEEVTVNS